MSRLLRALPVLCVAICAAAPLRAQLPGSVAADRARIAEISGTAPETIVGQVRAWSPSRRYMPWLDSLTMAVLHPHARVTYNSAIPFSLNDGPMWAGRGWNAALTPGVALAARRRGITARVVIAPTLLYSQNLPFEVMVPTDTFRSPWSSPFHGGDMSADLPLRFGDLYLSRIDPGYSGITISGRRIEGGIATGNEVWGPAVRGPLVMSANAPGIPRLFVRTAEPFRTRAGLIDARMIAGTLTESRFFDRVEINDHRSLSAALVSIRPAFDTMLTLGFERAVYAPITSSFMPMLRHSLDVFWRWETLGLRVDTLAGGIPKQRSDQISAIFARWIVPDAAFEAYLEYARIDLPANLTEILVAAHHTGGYTLGFQWAPESRARRWRLQGEVTYLEQSRVLPDRPQTEFYTSVASAQGYTQRGQVIGAATGPGSSSQFLGLDHLADQWQAGLFLGRIRWENDALYRQFVPNFFRHDVTVFGGLRGAWRAPRTDISAELTQGYRYNYLFQNGQSFPGGFRTVDARNFTFSVSVTPR